MSGTANIGNFTAVDGAPDAPWFIGFLDLANALPAYRAIREDLAATLGGLSGRRILEVGCGTGDDARELATLVGPAGRVVATDPSGTMLAEARRRSAGSDLPLEFTTGTLSGLDFPDGSFDGARAKLVLMHCEDIETAIDELVRVLRPGGRLAVFDYDFDTVVVDHPDMPLTRKVMRCFSDAHHNNWSGRQLFRRMRNRGLVDVSVSPHTVLLPFDFVHAAVAGRLSSAQESGELRLTADRLADWWRSLRRADETGRFFASCTGFVVGATKP